MPSTQGSFSKHGDAEIQNPIEIPMLVNTELRILQNNLHKSQPLMQSILNDSDMKQYAILLLQEQYWSSYTNSSLTHHSWTLYEPTTNNEQPRPAIYTNNNLLGAAQITHIDLPLDDVTAIEIATKDPQPTLIINVYKPCGKNIVPKVPEEREDKKGGKGKDKDKKEGPAPAPELPIEDGD